MTTFKQNWVIQQIVKQNSMQGHNAKNLENSLIGILTFFFWLFLANENRKNG